MVKILVGAVLFAVASAFAGCTAEQRGAGPAAPVSNPQSNTLIVSPEGAEAGEGRNVVAVAANGRTYYAFVSTEGDRKTVRLGFE